MYSSNALQVRVVWGETDTTAAWVANESWTVTTNLSTNTEYPLVVTFSDNDGVITLGSVEAIYNTGNGESDYLKISSEQFNTDIWDSDGDTVSNLDELLAGTNPLEAPSAPVSETLALRSFNLLDAAPSVSKTLGGFQLTQLAIFAEDLWYTAAHQTIIQWPNDDYYQVQRATTTVCEGGPQCRILPGNYSVINHTTGERTSLSVPVFETTDLAHATQLPAGINTPEGIEPPASALVEQTQFNCEHGGSVVKEYLEDEVRILDTLLIDSTDYDDVQFSAGGLPAGLLLGYFRTLQGFVFDQCQITINDAMAPSGTYTINGSMHTLTGGYSNIRYYVFSEFSVVGDDGAEIQVDGESEFYSFSSASYDYHRIRAETIRLISSIQY